MTSETKSEETKLNYDDRRKILKQKKSQVTENKSNEVKDGKGKVTEKAKLISTVSQNMEVDYTEEGIRLAHDNLKNEKEFLEKRIVELKEKVEKAGETPKEIKEFREKLAELTKYDEAEKAKKELDSIIERLKDISKDFKELTDEIGTRLKF